MPVSNITISKQDEAIKKEQSQESVISGIKAGKHDFYLAASALLRINEVSFNTCGGTSHAGN